MTLMPRSSVRRSARLALACIATLVLVAGRGSGRPDVLAQGNPIPAENTLPGDSDWNISGIGDPAIQGFATDMSVNVGGTVDFKVDVTPAMPFHLDIYRLGYYQGHGARRVTSILNRPGTVQDSCDHDGTTGLVDCGNWTVSAQWTVPADAVSGVYIAKAVMDGTHEFAETEGASHIVFIVRDDTRPADVLLQTSDTTWQAYNKYGGANLYCGGPIANSGAYAQSCPGRATKVSYNRPFDTRGHSPQSFLFNADYPMIRFLEANGYNVKYWSGIDTDRRGADLAATALKPRTFISVGHDEYWSGNQRTHVENARAAGVNLAFFSGNEVYWKTRWEASIDGTSTAHRTLVTYKETIDGAKTDPAIGLDGQPIWTGTWRDTRFGPHDGGRPENALIGSIWTVNNGTSAITVPASMAAMRLWRNTRVADLTSGEATLAPGTLGYEWGEDLDNGFRPAGLVRLSSTTVNNVEKIVDFGATVGIGNATHHLTLYRHGSALVFGASTVQWAWGLDGAHDDNQFGPSSHTPDQAMQQATVNLLADMGAQPSTLQEGADPTRPLVTSAQSSDIVAPTSTVTSPAPNTTVASGNRTTITGTAVDNGGGTVGGVEVSVDGGTTWKKATGTSSWTVEWTPGIVGTATIHTRATDDSGNVEAIGSGIPVSIIAGECPCTSLWNSSAVPANASAADSGEYELGVKFKSDVDGFITGIRFYKGPANTGTHVGNLWTSTGTLLASAVFTNETATGWQQVDFGSEVAITANTVYVASYHTPNGGYAFDPAYFTSAGKDSPPLHALPSGTSGGNGVFSPGAMAFPTNTFNGNNYWVDVVFAQSLEDLTAPVISAVKATTIDSSRVTVQWTTDEASHTRIDYGTDPAIQTASLASLPPGTITAALPAFVTQHSIALSGLQSNTTYYYLVSSTDAAGNTTTVAPPSFTVPGPTLRDTASSDFAAGTMTSTYGSQTADGEVILAPTVGSEFTGPGLSEGWVSVNWNMQGSAAVIDGVLLVDGARVSSCANPAACAAETLDSTAAVNLFAGPRSLEFSANYSGDQFQHAGLGQVFASTSEPWAIFSTLSGGMLFARTNTGNGAIDTPIGVAPLGEFHRYRIDWTPTSITYYVDGVLVATHNVAVAGPMRPVAASDFNPFGGIIFVDWMRLMPNTSPGAFESRVFDANAPVDWKAIQWQASIPAGTSLQISLRTGNTAVPDGSWSSWVPVAGPGAMSINSQFIQYRADMSSSDPTTTPALEDIIISTGSAPIAVPDSAAVAKNGSHTFPASGPGSLTFNDTEVDVNDTLSVVGVSAPSHGTVVLHADGSVTYTPASLYEGPDAFIYTVSDGLLTASATVSLDVRFGNIAPVAVDNFYAAVEDTTLTVPASAGLLANDTDAEHNVLQAQLVTLPAHGQLALGANGGFSYTPVVNYAGPDSFSYRAFDGINYSNTALVHLEIAQVNDAPFTEPDAFNALLDQPLDVPAPGVLANDHDVEVEDTAPLHTQLVSNVTHGQLILRADGSFSYVPNLSFLGTDSFTYKAVDHFDAASVVEKTVTLTVATKTAAKTVSAGETVSTGSGVSADNPLSSSVQTPVPATVRIAQGVISGSESPTLYTFLNQQVNITVTDATGAEVTASLTNPIVLTFQIDSSLVPAGQDHTTFEFFRNNVLVPDCLNATTIPDVNFDPCVSGRANSGDRITLTILTSHASTWNMGLEAASLGGAVIATSDGPFVTNFQVPIEKTAPGVLGDDFGPSTISAELSGTPEGGKVKLASSGAYTFTPDDGHCGPASFRYKARNGMAVSHEATVNIEVNCVPDAVSDTVSVVEDNVTTITVLSNDTDPEDKPLSITAATQGAHGTVTIAAGGMAVSYTPVENFFGSDSFTYTVQDPRGDTDTATVNLTVTPVNDAPSFVLHADQTVAEDAGPQTVSGMATAMSAGPVNESSQVLSFLVSNTNSALFSAQPAVDAEGVLTYTPAANAYGSATVTVRIRDDGGVGDGGADTSAPRTFAITVTPVNDDPIATPDIKTVAEDSGVNAIDVRANDALGPDVNETLSVSSVTQGAHGTTTFTATGVSYAPATNYNGPDSFTYTISDGNGGSVTATVNVTVTPVNDDPIANNDTATVGEDSGLNAIDVRLNDTLGPDAGETLTVDAVTQGAHGAVAVTATGVSYAPATNYNGPDSFTYTISDGNGGSATATVNVMVAPINDDPVANTDTATVGEDSGVNAIDVRANDTLGPDAAETLAISAVTQGAHGAVAITSAGVSYEPNGNYHGPDSFTYTITDGNGGTAVGTVNVTVTPVNDNPVANTDSATVAEDSGVTNIAVLTNDTIGPDAGETLTVTAVATAGHGTATVTATGVSYTPNANYFGPDSFTYTISDGNGGNATATVNVTVTSVNDNPVAITDNATVAEDSGVNAIDVRTNDTIGPDVNETLAVTSVTQGAHGTVAVTATGVSYAPAADYFGSDSFTYTINDGNGGTATATVNVTVTPVNDNPIANADSATVAEDSGVTNIAVRSNDNIGPDTGETLTVTAVTAAGHGTAAVTATGVSYAPAANYFGPDSFTYTISDGNGGSAIATVNVNVTPVNDNPIANTDNATVAEDSGVTHIAVRTNDTIGPDVGETLTVIAVTAAGHGTAAATASGVSYAPNANYFGSDSFTYTIGDGNGGSATATVNVNVAPVNDNPIANTDSVTVGEDSGVTNIAVRANDTTGPDVGETLTVIAVTAAGHGTAAVTATGVSYTPAAGYVGFDSFTYTISDGNGGSATATVSITVTSLVPSTTSKPTTSQTPAAYGTNLTFTTTVTGTGGTPTGLVEFFDGITSLGTALLNATGTASKTTNAVAAGTRAITAKYLGDSRFKASTSLPLTQTVTGVAAPVTTTFTASPLTLQYSDRMTFNASVSPATVGGQPAARVALFKVGTEVVGTAPLTLNAATGKLEATLNAPLLETTAGAMRPGIKTATVEFVQVAPGYTIANKSGSITVKAEDAQTAYTGPAEVVTTTGAATIRLEATVWELADGNPGDVRTATVAFINRTTGATIGAGILDTAKSTPTMAYYYFNYAVNIGANASQTFTIGTFVNGYYTRNATADNGTTIVKKP